ncbi:MAG: hypothetical protein BA864_02365 [Desulfuromonadales bacterium C00003093]|nr:MAG: hypothetical protein BA864_02365 [Desulfuromonadales bacterium C00003093]
MRTIIETLMIAFCCMIASGCAGITQSTQRPPMLAPTSLMPDPDSTSRTEGSLFNPNQNPSLIADFRARHVGDVVTILIKENLKGAKNVKTKTGRKSDMNIGLSGILGLEFEKRMYPHFENSPPGAEVDATKAIGGSSTDNFDGSGNTSRDAFLTGTVSARILRVLPGGNLIVQGTRELKINNETQYLILSGVIRPQDIDADNTISSTRLADARIEYTGGGALSEKQSPAWFARILGMIALF